MKVASTPRALNKADAFTRRDLVLTPAFRIREVHTDGERPHQGEVIQTSNRKVFPIDARFQDSVHGLQEVVAVRLNVKPNQIGAEQSVKQVRAATGQMSNASGFGHGMCQKIATLASGLFSLIRRGSSAKW